MTVQNIAAQDKPVRSQIIPLDACNLLLPNTCIAEVITYVEPEKSEASPDWLLGTINWRGLNIPLISFEIANDLPPGPISDKSRIIVLNGISGNEQLPFYGIFANGIPRLLNVEKTDLSEEHEAEASLALALEQIKVADYDAYIPNLDEIEKMLLSQ